MTNSIIGSQNKIHSMMHVADVKHASSEWQMKMSDKEECKHFDLFSFRLFASFLRSMTVILDDGMNELEN